MHNLIIRSRNKSCKPLAELEFSKKVVYRMGSTFKYPEVEINSAESCKVSGNKILMKTRFKRGNVCTAEWFTVNPNDFQHERLLYYINKWGTIIAKRKNSSKGTGIYLITNDTFNKFIESVDYADLKNFVFEKYYPYVREYRLHVTKDGCFCADRKMLKADAKDRWHRHSNNSVWIGEDNPKFDKPTNWDEIVKMSVNALKSCGLDICCVDVKVQSNKHKHPKFIILETNSAPALGAKTIELYKKELNRIVNEL